MPNLRKNETLGENKNFRNTNFLKIMQNIRQFHYF
jgi:hypothetical protein